jgi:hypothetical protein
MSHATLKPFAVRQFDHKLARAEQSERNWSGAAIFFLVAHALGNVTLLAQRLAKSTLDGPYKQFIHIVLWIISAPKQPTR